MQKLYINAFLIFFFSANCWAGVGVNPFLRPGSNQPPPQVKPAPPPPKPMPNPAFAKEVEFRGYFLLKGIPHFCIFNKKANFGEWIKLTEKTHEEFEAQAFDLDSETLTLAFNGQSFDLTLQESSGSSGLPQPASGLPKVTLPPKSPAPSAVGKKVMPPRPKSIPSMPEWLANRISSRSSLSRGGSVTARSSQSSVTGSRSARFAPPPRNSSTLSNDVGDNSVVNTSSNEQFTAPSTTSTSSLSNTSTNPSVSNPTNTTSEIPSSSVPDQSSNSIVTTSQESVQTELEDLPPPPPPPNILPPSPPPDIVPSMDE